jgi:LmbE family N-acetylglucosaminyl deacetylase
MAVNGDKKSPEFFPKAGSAAVIVAHPDDETLWAGGTMLMHPETKWTIITLCRKSDADRAPKFFRVVKEYGVAGFMGDLDDSPDANKKPLDEKLVKRTIMDLLPEKSFDVIITHSISGEYTRHLRHEETGKAVLELWQDGELSAGQALIFAYEDGLRQYLPRAIEGADLFTQLPARVWRKKYEIITSLYGFGKDSFEARTTPGQEAFWLKNKAGNTGSKKESGQ